MCIKSVLDFGDDATIIDVMEWMINTQLGRRNLPPAQRISVVDKFKKKIQEQAKENMSIGGSSDKKGSPNGETLIQKQTHTDKELAKKAGVGVGTVARYNRVMNSDDRLLDRFVRMFSNGEIGGSAKKVGKRIKELERLYGIREGSAGGNGSNQYVKKELEPNSSVEAKKSQSDLAAQMGISVDILQNYKILSEMIPELEELLDTGVVTKRRVLPFTYIIIRRNTSRL